MNKNKNDTDKVSQVVEVLGGIFAIIGLVSTITTLSDIFSKDKEKTIAINEDAELEVCDKEFKLKSYIQEDYDIWEYSIGEDIRGACEEYFDFFLREQIEEELAEEYKK